MQACCQGAQDHAQSHLRPIEWDAEAAARSSGSGEDRAVSPYTQGLVVVNRQCLPEQLFQRLRFTDSEKYGRLVTEFEYGKRSGELYYDVEARDDPAEDGYGRLITLNWWYQQLFLSIVFASLAISNAFCNVLFCVSLFTDVHMKIRVPVYTRCVFVALFLITEWGIIRKCRIEANKDWTSRADPEKVGDLIVGDALNSIDKAWAWAAMCCFKFINLDAIVKDIIIWLHPWKNVQPYGSFKADGHRCYVVGFASEYMFRCENKHSQQEFLSQQLFLVAVLATFKVNIVIESGTLLPLILTLPSVINFFVIMHKQWALVEDRKRHWQWLRDQHRHVEQDTAAWKAVEKQKSMHFPRQGWGDDLHERRAVVLRSVLAMLIPATFGVWMHFVDSDFAAARRAAAAAEAAASLAAFAGASPLGCANTSTAAVAAAAVSAGFHKALQL